MGRGVPDFLVHRILILYMNRILSWHRHVTRDSVVVRGVVGSGAVVCDRHVCSTPITALGSGMVVSGRVESLANAVWEHPGRCLPTSVAGSHRGSGDAHGFGEVLCPGPADGTVTPVLVYEFPPNSWKFSEVVSRRH